MSRMQNLFGQKFGRLTVVGREPDGTWYQKRWRCMCDCGQETVVIGGNLKSGHTLSCGCLMIEMAKLSHATHGATRGGNKTPEYRAWIKMRERCRDTSNEYYGGRGIQVCPRWIGKDGFINFLADMGPKPSPKHSIDRINGDYGYMPSNCRWATQDIQGQNSRNAKLTIFDAAIIRHIGSRIKMKDLAHDFGVSIYPIWSILKNKAWRNAPVVNDGLSDGLLSADDE